MLTTIFEILPDKDVILRDYERLTMFRLINETSASQEIEEKLLLALAKITGLDNISRLKQIFVDMETSMHLMAEFSGCIPKIDNFSPPLPRFGTSVDHEVGAAQASEVLEFPESSLR
mmetsp:Transcript_40890/g.53572  ORF Transcript_40890/g.53572 Transcript_40890/m.53572 type:complete len:117 (+) Transcript_40890:387-737(+)